MGSKFPGIKVYTASVDCLENPCLYEAWLRCVPSSRREKAERLSNPAVRRQSLGAAALLMRALSVYGGKDLMHLRIAERSGGKPYFPDFPEVHFSLSHSGNRVMCAVGPAEVGCDVEAVKTGEAAERRIWAAAKCLAPLERELVMRDPSCFYRIWTLKESFLKLTGAGFRMPLSSFEVQPDPPAVRVSSEAGLALRTAGAPLSECADESGVPREAPCSLRTSETLLSEYAEGILARDYGQIDGYQYACMSDGVELAEELICIDLTDRFIPLGELRAGNGTEMEHL